VTFAGLTVTNIATFGASAISMDIGASRRIDIGNTSMELGGGAVDFTINPGNSTARSLTIGQNSNAGFMVVEPSQVRIGVANTDVATLNTNTTNIQSYSNIFGRGTVGQNVFLGTKGSTILEIKADQDGSGGGTSARLQVRPDQTIIFYDTAYNQIASFSTASINVNQKIQPVGDNTTDLGSAGNQWRNLYVGGEIIANKLTIQYTTVTTTLVETDDIIKTTNTTAATANGTGALQVSGGASFGLDLWVNGGDIRGPRVRIEEGTTAGLFKNHFEARAESSGGNAIYGTTINAGFFGATNLGTVNSSTNTTIWAGTNQSIGGSKLTLKVADNGGGMVFAASATEVMTLTNTALTLSVPATINADLTANSVSATTATITYTNIATEGQLRSQSTSWPFGENTATIMTIDTSVYGSARLNILVGASFGLDSHTERLTMDILTNGVDVLNAQSGVLATTSTGLCSYTAELSGTDILVKAVALDPVNFLDYNAKTIAELVAKPVGGLGGL
jgi:hypothetical protein